MRGPESAQERKAHEFLTPENRHSESHRKWTGEIWTLDLSIIGVAYHVILKYQRCSIFVEEIIWIKFERGA